MMPAMFWRAGGNVHPCGPTGRGEQNGAFPEPGTGTDWRAAPQ